MNFTQTKNTVVCSEHFDGRCFYPRKESFDDAGKKRKTCVRRKPDSWPTRFSFRVEAVKRSSPETRRAVAAVRSTEHEKALEAKKLCPKRGESVLEFEQRLQLQELRAKVRERDGDIERLKLEVAHLKTQLFRFANVKHNPDELEFLTGLTPTVWIVVWFLGAVTCQCPQSESSSKGKQWQSDTAGQWQKVTTLSGGSTIHADGSPETWETARRTSIYVCR